MRYLMTFSYDGSSFYGYQIQRNKRTIQSEIETALTKINSNIPVKIHASGRTDSGVHAVNQKAHFDFKEIKPERITNSLNKLLSNDIYIKDVKVVDNDFHARYDVLKKEYIYKINMGEYNPCMRNYVLQLNEQLDVEKIKKACNCLIGKHNFKAFTKVNLENEKEDFIRNIYTIDLIKNNNELILKFIGSGFMRYMVRNMVGLLIDVGLGKFDEKKVLDILNSQDRKMSSKTAPACGLYLNEVYY